MSEPPVLAVSLTEIVPASGSADGGVRFVILGTGLSSTAVQFARQSGSLTLRATNLRYSEYGDWVAGDTPTWPLPDGSTYEDVDVNVTPKSGASDKLTYRFVSA